MPLLTTGAGVYAAAGGGSWTPASLSGLIVWLDANDAATITHTGGNVTAWNDKSGTGNHFTGNNNPVYSTTSFPGSKPGITFTAGSSTSLTGSTVSMGSTTSYSVFMVLDVTGSSANSGIICAAPSAGGNDFNGTGGWAFTTPAGGGANGCRLTRVSFDVNNGSTPTGNAAHTYGFIIDSNVSGVVYGDFTNIASGTPTSITQPNVNIGIGGRMAPNITSNYISGIVSEVIITTNAMSGTDRSNLQSYFTTKWGTP